MTTRPHDLIDYACQAMLRECLEADQRADRMAKYWAAAIAAVAFVAALFWLIWRA